MNRIKFITLILLLICSSSFLVQESYATTRRYRIMWNDDPATTMVVGWEALSGTRHFVYYDVVDHGVDTALYSNRQGVTFANTHRGMDNRFAKLTGLSPNTSYYFVVGDELGKSQRYWFKTASNLPSSRLSFVAGGDSRNNRAPRQNANRIVAKLRPHAVLFGGDMTDGDSNTQWAGWLDDWQLTIGADGRMIPIMAARGNHEYSSQSISNIFNTTTNAYYAITFGNGLIRTYTLNTEISINGNQTSWLEEDLENNCDVTWRMAQYHKPIRPHVASKGEGNNQYTYWAPLFYEYNFNLVVECDAHAVKTTWPIRPSTLSGNDEGFVRDDEFGTTFVGEGCWGAPLRGNNDNKSWTRESGSFNQVKWIFIDQDKIEVRTVEVMDSTQTVSIATVNDSDIFTTPANLQLWNPPTGQVVTITRPKTSTSILHPISGNHYPILPTTIQVDVIAADTNGSISKVELFLDGSLIGTMTTPPYNINWTLSSAGQYTFQAVAYDNASNKKYSCPVKVTADNTILPPDWISFDANLNEAGHVEIRWETLAGLKHISYVVERSGTDQNFLSVKTQDYLGAQIQGVKYVYIDKDPLPGYSYYRIRSINRDGSHQFTNTKEIVRPGASESNFKVFPSPVPYPRSLSIDFFSVDQQQIQIRLFDGSGKEIVKMGKQVKKGHNWLQFKPGPISGGIYYLQIDIKGKAHVRKVVFR